MIGFIPSAVLSNPGLLEGNWKGYGPFGNLRIKYKEQRGDPVFPVSAPVTLRETGAVHLITTLNLLSPLPVPYTLLYTCRSYGALFHSLLASYIHAAPTGLRGLFASALLLVFLCLHLVPSRLCLVFLLENATLRAQWFCFRSQLWTIDHRPWTTPLITDHSFPGLPGAVSAVNNGQNGDGTGF